MFSFNKEVGSTSLDAGYKLGWGIANNGANVRTVPSVAGGICQVATTLFHSVFWSGYQLEERNYHLYWITGYNSNLEGHEYGKTRYNVYQGGAPRYLKKITTTAAEGYPEVHFE